MCQIAQDIMDKLTETVKTFLDEGRMFTGYDVTIETRNKNKIKIKHEDVRGAIHEIAILTDAIEFGYDGPDGTTNWSKTQKMMPNNSYAFVFHPSNLDPDQYQGRNTNTNTVNYIGAIAPSLSISSKTNTKNTNQRDGFFVRDKRGRLMVTTSFMKKAEIESGSICYVIPDLEKDTIVICKVNLATSGIVRKIEKNGDLRLSKESIKMANLDSVNEFVIENGDINTFNSVHKIIRIKSK